MKLPQKKTKTYQLVSALAVLLSISSNYSCKQTKETKGAVLYKTHCASCHVLPSIEDLPKSIWENQVLPEMAARMGIKDSLYNPVKGRSFEQQMIILKSGIYPNRPIISKENWLLLQDYILELAPDSLKSIPTNTYPLTQFNKKAINIDNVDGSYSTFLEFDTLTNKIITGNLNGSIFSYEANSDTVIKENEAYNPTTSISTKNKKTYITTVGILNPNELSKGEIIIIDSLNVSKLPFYFHRPVHTIIEDLNDDKSDEIVISEFGDLTGALTLLYTEGETSNYKKKILLNQPGAIRTIAKEMNKDGKLDIVALTAQGNEGVHILYQKDDLNFQDNVVLRMSPVYGASWFDLVDFNMDGYDDIIVVNGDNADKSFIAKPYHGLRIFLNDGNNEFKEAVFYPINGATKFVSKDFDQDGDIDFGITAAFPDYTKASNMSFVYLETINSKKFEFKAHTIENNTLGRWFLIDAGDFDKDGDDDMVLSSFTYTFTPVPNELSTNWKNSNCDMLILENTLLD